MTRKRAERTKHDVRCPICPSAIGQASCLICARRRQLTFPFCCYISLLTPLTRSKETAFKTVRYTTEDLCRSRKLISPLKKLSTWISTGQIQTARVNLLLAYSRFLVKALNARPERYNANRFRYVSASSFVSPFFSF